MIIANVIWPTFITPYVLWIFLPFMGPMIFGIEIFIGIKLRKNESSGKTAKGIAIANVCSSLLGVFAGMALSGIPGEANLFESSDAHIYLFLSYAVTFLISFVIEALIMNKYFKSNSWRLSLIMNSTTYGCIALFWIMKAII